MIGDFFSKPLQGSKFIRFRGEIMGSAPITPPMAEPVHKECIETSDPGIPSETNVEADPATSWTEVVRKKRKKKTNVSFCSSLIGK
jgi:hypothetical protein